MKRNIIRLTIFYVVFYGVFNTFMLINSSVPFVGNELAYVLIGILTTAVVCLFYSFSLLLLLIAELVGKSDFRVQESKNLRRYND